MREQTHEIEQERLRQLSVVLDTEKGPLAMVRLLARIIGVGIETSDMLVNEILSRSLRDRRAVALYAGPTGAPDESGQRRREKGLARAGNARVRYGMILLAWRFLQYQKDSALAHGFCARTADGRGGYAQDDDRGFGTQATDCILAACHDRRDPDGSSPASGVSWRSVR
ncbi:IS110 family transposase [Mesorhizobium sp. M0119]|uniref:transposase n=1 Tax=Mesorhizobium sp. M0119 TaxID=2956885 RepID=UPI00333ABF54